MRPEDRGLEEAGVGYLMAEEDWPFWPRRDLSVHSQAVPHGMGPSRKKRLCGGSEVRPRSAVFSRPKRAGCIPSRGPGLGRIIGEIILG